MPGNRNHADHCNDTCSPAIFLPFPSRSGSVIDSPNPFVQAYQKRTSRGKVSPLRGFEALSKGEIHCTLFFLLFLPPVLTTNLLRNPPPQKHTQTHTRAQITQPPVPLPPNSNRPQDRSPNLRRGTRQPRPPLLHKPSPAASLREFEHGKHCHSPTKAST